MRFEAGFITCYVLMLLGTAAGLHRLGKVDTSPWRSRALAGHRRQVALPPAATTVRTEWPHSEAGRLHTLVALVTVLAAATLAVVEVVRHHRPVEAVVLGVLGGVAAVTTVRLTRAFTGHGRRDRRDRRDRRAAPEQAGGHCPPTTGPGVGVEDEAGTGTYVDLDADLDAETLRWAGEGPAAAPAEQ